MKDPKLAHSQEPNETPFNAAFKTDLRWFDWYELPENEYRRRRFATALAGAPVLTKQSVTGDVVARYYESPSWLNK